MIKAVALFVAAVTADFAAVAGFYARAADHWPLAWAGSSIICCTVLSTLAVYALIESFPSREGS